ncbi:Telomeric DNA-binding factor trf1 [Erysiphe neolycopersici]|uniref:Telomeric DNA-binding factor trf1 n=1 Tax=Erysiphe neolycopersici TaxID=212602 RepID=A0A420HWK6_9PEZI|nr:Telomeric DNA-binding factor trf1 [Erysiphe neolycopersici]
MIDNEASIKHESSGSSNSNQEYGVFSPSSGLKHVLSDYSVNNTVKRQKIESNGTPASSPDLSSLLAHVTECVSEQNVLPEMEANMGMKQTNHGAHIEDNEIIRDSLTCMRILSLPMLENLATQIISLLCRKDSHEIVSIVNVHTSELGKIYYTLKSLLDQVKKIYVQQGLFLSADVLNLKEIEYREIIRITNLATFVCNVFDRHEVGFLELNDHFIEIFTPEGIPLSKEAGDLFLNLKTQIYLSAISQEEQERTREDILEEYFPNNLEKILEYRHPNQPLSQSEYEFTRLLISRRDFLANAPIDLDSIQALSENFSWEGFLKQVAVFLDKVTLLTPYLKRYGLNVSLPVSYGQNMDYLQPVIDDDLGLQVELAAKQTLESLGLNNSQSQYERSTCEDQYTVQNGSYLPDYSNLSLPLEQTAPTQVLYERARHAAVAKASPSNTRRPGLPSQRRPWSSEEERALMAGLDQVRGPYWSQILALYGAKGTINEVLKDRNQVQLKDKARNLKLFFLKSGIEVPYHLKAVTGELKTRAPTQAAKREAEERARLADMNDRGRLGKVTDSTGVTNDQDPILSILNFPMGQTEIKMEPEDEQPKIDVGAI